MDITAQWIWRKQDADYNDTIIAKKDITLSQAVSQAIVSVTADSIYRLIVNGQWVCDGPARGWPEHYYYDQVDVAEWLQPGRNEIRLIATYYGIGHFHGMPQRPGLLAQLDLRYTDDSTDRIKTDASWQVAPATGWSSSVPKISCQMGPAEFYDARCEDERRFEAAAVVCSAHDGPWKDIKPRDVAMLTRKPVFFRRVVAAALLKEYRTDRTYCLPWARLLYPGLVQANRRLMPAFAVATVIETETPITFTVDINDYRNGRYPVFIDGAPANEQTALAAGRHLLFIGSGLNLNHTTDTTITVSADGPFTLLHPYASSADNAWAFLQFESFKCAENDMRWVKFSSQFQACMEGYQARIDALGGIGDIEAFVAETAACVTSLAAHEMFADDRYHRFLTRQPISDDAPAVTASEAILSAGNEAVVVAPSDKGDVELAYDLGEQNVGYYSFELEAEPGVEIDIYSVEYIAPDGNIQFPDDHRNGMTYVTKAGTNRFDCLKRRSGRYVFVRFVNQTKPIHIRRFQLIESTYPAVFKGFFECSDASLNNIWEISARTLKLCMEDTFTDCPLYEQTLWVGDARNESLFAYGVFGAEDIARRCIVLAAQSLERFPMVGCQLPSSWHCILPAWSFLWGISVWDYYWHTADKAFLEAMWPFVIKNLKGAAEYINEAGLFSGDLWNLFDWAAIDQDHETVLHNSMFMVGAVEAAVKCGRALGRDDQTEWLYALKAQLCTGINKCWQPARKAYPDSIHEDGTVSPSVSQHTCFLSLLYDIAEPAMEPHLLEHILHPAESVVKVGSPFAILYLYEMLDKYGRNDCIIDSIKEAYLPMLAADATTVWESFAAGTLGHDAFPTRSHCHAWSSAPLYFFNRVILGIRQTAPGGTSFEITPYAAGLKWAKGAVATSKGTLEVAWKKNADGTLDISCAAPDGVTVTIKDNE